VGVRVRPGQIVRRLGFRWGFLSSSLKFGTAAVAGEDEDEDEDEDEGEGEEEDEDFLGEVEKEEEAPLIPDRFNLIPLDCLPEFAAWTSLVSPPNSGMRQPSPA